MQLPSAGLVLRGEGMITELNRGLRFKVIGCFCLGACVN